MSFGPDLTRLIELTQKYGPVPVRSARRLRQLAAAGVPAFFRRDPVWQGVAKRGNRRGRARWDYRR